MSLLQQSNVYSGWLGNFNPNVPASIASGQTTSGAVELKGLMLCGILLPAAFTGTTLTFLVSVDGTNFYTLKTSTSGTTLSYTVAQGTYAALNPQDFYGVNYLKIVSGSSEGAARTLALAVRGGI